MLELSDLISPIITIVCAVMGSYIGISGRLVKMETKLDAIEKKQDKHNNVIERVYRLENALNYVDGNIEEIKKDINHYHR